MTFARIEALRNRLSGGGDESSQESLQREVQGRAISLHCRIGRVKKILDENFGGFLNLGKDPEQICWDLMPEKIVTCFQPEFEFQRKDIDHFGLSISEISEGDIRQINFRLSRKGRWWSFVSLGVTAKERDYYGGRCIVDSRTKHDQPEEAREAIVALRKFIWRGEPADREGGELEISIRSLDLSEALLIFMVGEMERQTEQASE